MVAGDISNLIANLGFPIASCLGMMWFIKQMLEAQEQRNDKRYEQLRDDSKERENHYREHQALMVTELGRISNTIERVELRLTDIENTVVKNKEEA